MALRRPRPNRSIVELKDYFRPPNQAEFVPGRALDRGGIVFDSRDFGAKLPNLLRETGQLLIGSNLLLAQAL